MEQLNPWYMLGGTVAFGGAMVGVIMVIATRYANHMEGLVKEIRDDLKQMLGHHQSTREELVAAQKELSGMNRRFEDFKDGFESGSITNPGLQAYQQWDGRERRHPSRGDR